MNTLKDHILYAMNAKREEVFTELCAFQGECYVSPHAFGEVQPQHACNHARRQRDPVSGARVCDILKIGCGFEETAINARLYPDLFKVLETQEVVRRFFDGKVGTEGPTAEEQRSHVGYSPENAALGLISYLNSAGVAAGVDRMLEDEFKTINAKLPDLEVEYWLSKRGNQIKVGKTYDIGLSDEEALAEFDTFSKTFNSRADFLEEIRANHLPSEYRLGKTGALKEPKVPTSFGIRQLLLMHGILIKK
ncbi:MAG: hypothetical protein HYX41_00650 [Bdellovibrio sp.]|nr:hypothetical protein [Bdellovibrio sp.]